MTIGRILRDGSHRGVESLVGSAAKSIGVERSFSDDTLSYFVERLAPAGLRDALVQLLRRAKRNKAFARTRLIGLALDGSAAGSCGKQGCELCVPIKDSRGTLHGYHHRFSMISVVGTELSLPFDVEPYGPGDSEYAASQRLLKRALGALGPRFADYVVADGQYATAPFLHTASKLGLRVVARLKENLPTLLEQAKRRFEGQLPSKVFRHNGDRIEIWDADDFDPWETLEWQTVRVIRYRQHKPQGKLVEAYWLTNFARAEASSNELFMCAKNRWAIENQGFNDGKNRFGMDHIHHHETNSIVVGWLTSLLAIVIERLYRCRYLRRGSRPILSAIELLRTLRLALGAPLLAPLALSPPDSS